MINYQNLHDILTIGNLNVFGFESDFIEFLQEDIAICMDMAGEWVEQSNHLLSANTNNTFSNTRQEPAVDALGTAATLYRRAGANALLIWDSSREVRSNQNPFLYSARCYYQLGSSYDDMLKALMDFKDAQRILTSEPVAITGQNLRQRIQFFADDDPVQRVFQEIYSVSSEHYPVDKDLVSNLRVVLRGINIGVLDIPAARYLDLVEALDGKRDLVEVYQFFIQTYNEAFQTAMGNSYLWNLLAHPFHPAEPDILTILTLNKEAGLQALENVQGNMLEADVEILKRILDVVE